MITAPPKVPTPYLVCGLPIHMSDRALSAWRPNCQLSADSGMSWDRNVGMLERNAVDLAVTYGFIVYTMALFRPSRKNHESLFDGVHRLSGIYLQLSRKGRVRYVRKILVEIKRSMGVNECTNVLVPSIPIESIMRILPIVRALRVRWTFRGTVFANYSNKSDEEFKAW